MAVPACIYLRTAERGTLYEFPIRFFAVLLRSIACLLEEVFHASTKPLLVALMAFALPWGFLAPAAPAQATSKLQVLYAFHGKDGQSPSGGVIFDAVGNLYGTTALGGDEVSCSVNGCGTVFELTPGANGKWTEKVLHAFHETDGSDPSVGVIFDSTGNLYGTTSELGYFGDGNVFKLTPASNGKWRETVLHIFDGTDGVYPFAGVVLDAKGNLYGATDLGGDYTKCRLNGCGTVFKLAPRGGVEWSDETIHAFERRDGEHLTTGVILGVDGNLYGTAGGGPRRGGVVFKLTPDADGKWTETLVYDFGGVDAVYDPVAVIFDREGNLYGTAFQSGLSNCGSAGCGGVFELMPSADGKWTEKVLYTFHGSDGETPDAALTFDKAGNLYGTTFLGGDSNQGVIFKLTPHANGKWTETVLHSFNGNDGAEPSSALIFDTAGSLYGTTYSGGNFSECNNKDGCGVVFKFTP